jgi:hypothetical protein
VYTVIERKKKIVCIYNICKKGEMKKGLKSVIIMILWCIWFVGTCSTSTMVNKCISYYNTIVNTRADNTNNGEHYFGMNDLMGISTKET